MKIMTAHDIAELLHITYPTALSFIKFSGVRYLKVGKSYRVLDSDLMEFLQTTDNINIDLYGTDQIITSKENKK